MKELFAGLWSALCLGVTMLWESGVKWWGTASLNKRTAVVIVVGVLLSIGMVRCVAAEPNSDSGYTLVVGQMMSAACYVERGLPISGPVVPCLVGVNTPNGSILINGTTVFCTITGQKETVPVWSCSPTYEETLEKITGI